MILMDIFCFFDMMSNEWSDLYWEAIVRSKCSVVTVL